MCGFLGHLSATGAILGAAAIADSLKVLRHRGPDGEGIFQSWDEGLTLLHRRLAILDPEHGAQPCSTPDGRYTLVFNGEIYNYLELRRELITRGHPIGSYSDTEVLLYSFVEWGDQCIDRLLGMFSFAIWDRDSRELLCGRDRLGIKPFYYHWTEREFVFGSEIKALLATGRVTARPDQQGIRDYITFQYTLNSKTLFHSIEKLEPGHFLKVRLGHDRLTVAVYRYWDLKYETDHEHDERWFIDRLSGLLEDAVRIHLRSDVPIGTHLSGGLDSTVLTCLASRLLGGEKIASFTGAFREGPQFDETNYAKIAANYAKTLYHEVYISGSDLPNLLPTLIYLMDEPAAGPGVIPQYYLSKLAAQHVKVVLGGQGGDEIFIGYARYLVAVLEQSLKSAINGVAASSASEMDLESIIPSLSTLQGYQGLIQGVWKEGLFDSVERRYFRLIDRSEGTTHLYDPVLFEGHYSPFEEYAGLFSGREVDGPGSLVDQMTSFDIRTSLPALLQVEDRTSMAASIESRVPLLDHRIVELMATIPTSIKFSRGRLKYLFKEAVRSSVPLAVLDRQDKMGFPTPFNRWVKGSAREFVADTLLSTRVRERGIYNFKQIVQTLDGEGDYGRLIWGLLCLELWHRVFIDVDGYK
jgi:asparagine synthase (glutamine-hydrolysing)